VFICKLVPYKVCVCVCVCVCVWFVCVCVWFVYVCVYMWCGGIGRGGGKQQM